MNHAVAQKVLTRMVRPVPQQGVEAQSVATRLRLAIGRAAAFIGLEMKPFSTAVRESKGADIARALPDACLLVTAEGADGVIGFFALDQAVVAAIRDTQLRGSITGQVNRIRDFTGADCTLVAAFLSQLRCELGELCHLLGMDGDANAVEIGLVPRTATSVALSFARHDLVLVEAAVSLGETELEGRLSFGFRKILSAQTPDEGRADGTWRTVLANNVLDADLALQVVLGRMHMPLHEVLDIALGDVIPLNGIGISGLRVETAGGDLLCHARLGQAAGLRAVRREALAPHDLQPPQIAATLTLPTEEGR